MSNKYIAKKHYLQMNNANEIGEIFGTITKIIDINGVSQSGNAWKRRTVVVRRDCGLMIALELWGDSIDLNNIKEDDKISCMVNVTSKEWQGRWFTQCTTKFFKIYDQMPQHIPNEPPMFFEGPSEPAPAPVAPPTYHTQPQPQRQQPVQMPTQNEELPF